MESSLAQTEMFNYVNDLLRLLDTSIFWLLAYNQINVDVCVYKITIRASSHRTLRETRERDRPISRPVIPGDELRVVTSSEPPARFDANRAAYLDTHQTMLFGSLKNRFGL